MRTLRLLAAVVTTLAFGGCFQSTTVLKVKADGSGTIEQRTTMTAAALAQVRQFASTFGTADGKKIDLFSEEEARRAAAQLGEGVTLVASTPISTGDGEGRETVYAFRDVTKVDVIEALRTSAGVGDTVAAGADGAIDFKTELTRTSGGNAVFTLHMPGERLETMLKSRGADRGQDLKPSDVAMLKQMFGGMRVAIQIQPVGRVVRTNSPYVDGQTVTVFDLDLDELLKNEAQLNRLQNANTADEVTAALKDTRGLKIALDSDISIEFTPAR